MLNISMCVAGMAQIFLTHVATMKGYIFEHVLCISFYIFLNTGTKIFSPFTLKSTLFFMYSKFEDGMKSHSLGIIC